MDDLLPGLTRREAHRLHKERDHRDAVVAAHRALADMLEADEDIPVPHGDDIVVSTAPSVAAVNRFAARYHVEAGWNGRVYKAEVRLNPELRFCLLHLPARDLDECLDALDATAEAEIREGIVRKVPVAA